MAHPPETLDELQTALALNHPTGEHVASWRDQYDSLGDMHRTLVDLCIEYLYERRLCYSCGQPADRLVLGEFPWVCAACEPLA